LQLGKLVSSFPQRAEVRPEVTLMPSPAASPIACAVQATAEIFDNFTKTAWVVAPGVCIPPGPTTMPIGPAFCPPGPTNIPPGPQTFGPVGLTLEQTARLNVVAHPPQPCAGTLGFIDPRGIAIIPPNPQQGSGQKSVDLASGQATYLDLTGLAAAPGGCRCLLADDRTAVLHRLLGGVRPRYRLDAHLRPAGANQHSTRAVTVRCRWRHNSPPSHRRASSWALRHQMASISNMDLQNAMHSTAKEAMRYYLETSG
jgi:hypothetical protein